MNGLEEMQYFSTGFSVGYLDLCHCLCLLGLQIPGSPCSQAHKPTEPPEKGPGAPGNKPRPPQSALT